MRALRIVLGIVGAVAMVIALAEVLLGPHVVMPGNPVVDPSVDSNYRFFAAFFGAAGLAILLNLRRLDPGPLRWILGAFFAGGLARLFSLAETGEPVGLVYGLLALELVAPPLLLLWHHRVTGHLRSDSAASGT
ncbi:DUF4345 domain-containing protein [Pseudonocardiaceae bacterium YIM PH 21723]|nr:DUF4345 domain-containing protein [Pseudonocardiaceae bacterium YIM PH 21723]